MKKIAALLLLVAANAFAEDTPTGRSVSPCPMDISIISTI